MLTKTIYVHHRFVYCVRNSVQELRVLSNAVCFSFFFYPRAVQLHELNVHSICKCNANFGQCQGQTGTRTYEFKLANELNIARSSCTTSWPEEGPTRRVHLLARVSPPAPLLPPCPFYTLFKYLASLIPFQDGSFRPVLLVVFHSH